MLQTPSRKFHHPVTRTLCALLAVGGGVAFAVGLPAILRAEHFPTFSELLRIGAALAGIYIFSWYAIRGGKQR